MTKVLIVGRPNVGKSSLFNRLIKNRRSLVLDQPGVTRDIIKGEAHWWGHGFEVWDSGGLVWEKASSLSSVIKKQVKTFASQADLIVFIMDARLGLQEEDKKIFKWVKHKKTLLVVNKVDRLNEDLSDFYALGSKHFVPAAFEKDKGVDVIVDWIIKYSKNEKSKKDKAISFLITGQSNAGKSSLCNFLLKKNRMITSAEAHTTVDVVDEVFEFKDRKYEVLDSAGIRKKSRRMSDLEKISSAKSLSYFDKADLILLTVPIDKGISKQDVRLFSYCIDRHKPVLLVISKWDLSSISKEEMKKKIKSEFLFFPTVLHVFTSALKGKGLGPLMNKICECAEKSQTYIPTSKLNQFFIQAIHKAPMPVYGPRNVKFYYLTQNFKNPPGFIVFVNEPKGISSSYKRFLIKQIQKKFRLEGIPLRLNFVKKT